MVNVVFNLCLYILVTRETACQDSCPQPRPRPVTSTFRQGAGQSHREKSRVSGDVTSHHNGQPPPQRAGHPCGAQGPSRTLGLCARRFPELPRPLPPHAAVEFSVPCSPSTEHLCWARPAQPASTRVRGSRTLRPGTGWLPAGLLRDGARLSSPSTRPRLRKQTQRVGCRFVTLCPGMARKCEPTPQSA